MTSQDSLINAWVQKIRRKTVRIICRTWSKLQKDAVTG